MTHNYDSFLGIIFMYNCLDSFELDLILEEIEKSVPESKSVLIVANFSDMDEYDSSISTGNDSSIQTGNHDSSASDKHNIQKVRTASAKRNQGFELNGDS